MKRLLLISTVVLSMQTFNAVAQKQVLEQTASQTDMVKNEFVLKDFDRWMLYDWGVSVKGGVSYFIGDVSEYHTMSDVKPNTGGAFIFTLDKSLTRKCVLRGSYLYTTLSGAKSHFNNGDIADLYFKGSASTITTDLKFDLSAILFGNNPKLLSFYTYGGVGLIDFYSKLYNTQTGLVASQGYANNVVSKATREIIFPLGIGVDINFSSQFSIALDAGFYLANSDKLDAFTSSNNKSKFQDGFNVLSIGATYKLGYGDADKDGVVNRYDKCPLTAPGLMVCDWGCIKDQDKDGVADNFDECPEVFGSRETKGCPDKDGDGVADKHDVCVDVKGLKEFQGCPDTDADGVSDLEDLCPEVKGLIEFKGCADTDSDGVADNLDKCPTIAGAKQFEGCPDTDGDGVGDNIDKCPKEKGLAANLGCPEVKKSVLKVFEKALNGIQFETGKDIILKTSFLILNEVAKVLLDNPTYNIEINGHTDNVGKSDANIVLSQKRAEAVRKYLISKGVAESRMVASGYGDTKPVADNKTKAGKAKNRRVEFKVRFEALVAQDSAE